MIPGMRVSPKKWVGDRNSYDLCLFNKATCVDLWQDSIRWDNQSKSNNKYPPGKLT